jgi:LysR family transcriptional regulator, glycine cleavage system transcriptional activator
MADVVAPSHLKSLQALEVAICEGSLAGAANVLGITPAAVGQRVKSLEEYLGVDLLVRGRSGIQAAPALVMALPHLQTAFGELKLAADALELERGCELHVAAPPDFVELWLEPRLENFRKAHPNVKFCLNGIGEAPLPLGKVDCEIQFGPLPTEQSDADLLFHDLIAPICSPTIFKRRATLPPRIRLEDFPLLHLDFYKDDPSEICWTDWVARNNLTRTAPARGIRFQRMRAALDAVLADAGFTLCGLGLIRDQIEDNRITLAYPKKPGVWTKWAFTARFRRDVRKRAPVKLFRDWLVQEAKTTADWLKSGVGQAHPV